MKHRASRLIARIWPWLNAGIVLALAVYGQRQLQSPTPSIISWLGWLALAGAGLLVLHRPQLLQSQSSGLIYGGIIISIGLSLGAASLHQEHQLGPAALLTMWGIGWALLLAIAAWADRQHRASHRPLQLHWEQRDWLVVALLIILAAYLRMSNLTGVPATMSGDEGNMAMEAVRVRSGELVDPFTTGWLSHPTLWFYIMAGSMNIFGETMMGARMASAVIGSLTPALAYIFGRLLFSRRIAVIGAGLLATYHFHIHYSRFALNNVADPFWGLIILSTWLIALRTRRRLAWAATGVGAGLALYFYHGARLFIPLLAVLLSIEVFKQRRRWRELRTLATWQPLGWMGVGFGVAALPIIQTFIKTPVEFMARVNLQRWTSEDIAAAVNAGRSTLDVIIEQVLRAFLPFNAYVDISTFYDDRNALLYGIAAALLALGGLIALWRIRQPGPRLLVIWYVLAAFLGNFILRNPPNSPRYVTLTPVVCLLIAIAIDALIQPLVATMALRWRRWGGALLAASLTCYLALVSVNGYFYDYIQRENIGGTNTHAAMALLDYLQHQPANSQVWFMVPPRMFYHGFAMLDYLARDVTAVDVMQPITDAASVPPAATNTATLYVASPERLNELYTVSERYPGGTIVGISWITSDALLFVYQIPAP